MRRHAFHSVSGSDSTLRCRLSKSFQSLKKVLFQPLNDLVSYKCLSSREFKQCCKWTGRIFFSKAAEEMRLWVQVSLTPTRASVLYRAEYQSNKVVFLSRESEVVKLEGNKKKFLTAVSRIVGWENLLPGSMSSITSKTESLSKNRNHTLPLFQM